MGESMVLNLVCLFAAIVIVCIISYFILMSNSFSRLNVASIFGIILAYIILGILTYYPPINDLFYDPMNEKYGINTYDI